MNRIIFILLIYFLNPLLASGQEVKRFDKALENISVQYAKCAAYYRLVSHAMASSNDRETANKYGQVEETAMFYSLLLASEARSKDLAVKVTNSRIEMYIKKMKQEINNRNENISILINNYSDICQAAITNPPDSLLSVLKTKIEKLNK